MPTKLTNTRTPVPIGLAQAQTKALRKQAGLRLKELRSHAGLSQIELAAALGVRHYAFISQVESGVARVPIDSMEAWARALGTDPAEFAYELVSYYEPELHRLLRPLVIRS